MMADLRRRACVSMCGGACSAVTYLATDEAWAEFEYALTVA